MLNDWDCPPPLDKLTISNGLASFLIKGLSKHLNVRHRDIAEFK